MFTNIESSDNNKIKLVRRLANKKARDEENKIVIEGINLVREAVHRGIDIDFIMISDGYVMEDFVQDCIEADSLMVCQIPESIFNKVVDAENGVGVIAVVSKPTPRFEGIGKLCTDGNVLVLDRIQDPGNMGTMIRTAVAAGYEMIIATKGTVDVYSAKVLRATAGMIFDIPVIYEEETKELFKKLKDQGKKIVVTSVNDGEPYYKQDLKNNVALVIGNEGNGVSKEAIEMADVLVTIPMQGDIESLNAAVSAAVLMYESIRE